MELLKEIFDKVDLKKKSADDIKKHVNIPSMISVKQPLSNSNHSRTPDRYFRCFYYVRNYYLTYPYQP